MKILTVATAWGSRHGGVNVFNYRLSCALAALGHEVTSYVKLLSSEDIANASTKKVNLKHINKPSESKWGLDDIGHIKYVELRDFDLIIIHDIVGKAFLEGFNQSNKKILTIVFIHTLYRDTDYFGDMTDDVRREKTQNQYALINMADIVFTSGGWIRDQLIAERSTLKGKIKSFVPGRLAVSPSGSMENGAITTFGRLSLSVDKKQASTILDSYRTLVADSIVDGKNSEELPPLRLLGVNCSTAIQQEIKQEIFSAGGWEGRVEFLDFQQYYDFESSTAKQIVADSKIIITPSIVESFGLTSLESIGLGIPLITGRRSGFEYELRKHVSHVPETAIEWLEPSDFKDLTSSLRSKLRLMLQRYDSYRQGAMVLAESILASWPTWEVSTRAMCTEISGYQLVQPAKPIFQDGANTTRQTPFSNLRNLINPPLLETNELAISSSDSAPSDNAHSISELSTRWQLERAAKYVFGQNLTPGADIERLINNRYSGKICTKLQQQVIDAIQSGPLHNYQDILLCGGTSSGKTTMAEVLFGVANNSDFTSSRILYLAPTRALAQERWRDWSQCFGDINIPRCDEKIIISTGEDNSNDRALARGDFLIACLVFEKANVILSTSPDLVEKLTMVVVDELHMISDIHRGPIIETLLAKIKYEKRRRQKRDDLQLPLRIVGITTERSAADGFEYYFTNLDRMQDLEIPPIRATDAGRPKQVRHVLIEPEGTGQSSYRETVIGTFHSDDSLHLSQDQLNSFAARLAEHSRQNDISIYRGGRGVKLKYSDKYLSFIKDWLHNNPNGKRLLVFIGSKADQVHLADRLQSEIRQSYKLANRIFNIDRLAPILEKAKNDDTSIAIDVLARALSKGVFIHNADINRNLRFSIEEYLSRSTPSGVASEIIIATETLSYGVNLTIDDIALLSLEFPASERNQEYGATARLLSRCAFANMCGRAGRLNQINDEATIYVWAITGHEMTPKRLVEIFYCDHESVGSKIVHGDDKEAYERLHKINRTTLAPLLFTYPFVRTFLDGLRFTGGSPGLNGATRRNDATIEELEDEFTDYLLYSQEHRRNPSNIERLQNSARSVIIDSMHPNLELVKKSGRGYKITQLGASIIDTGTEISTLEPLKKALESLLILFSSHIPNDQIPVEALLLPILVQNEAHRQVISGMPEFRTEIAKDENRKIMLAWLKDYFSDLGFTEQVVHVLEKFLAKCDLDPRHTPSGETSTELVHDACLRLFCGLLMWVSGSSISDIHIKLKVIGKISGNPVQINSNFAALAERMSWKVKFLGDLMRFTRGHGDIRLVQTRARRLIIRLHLGCAENALPFLANDGNRRSVISRKTAHELLKAGATPKSISSGGFDLDEYPMVLANQIRTQVRGYIRSSFHNLKNEFVYSTAEQGAESISRAYWEFADTAIRRSTENNSEMPIWPTAAQEMGYVSVRASPGAHEIQSPSVRLKEEDGALLIVGHKIDWRDDTGIPVDAVKWQIQASHGKSNALRPGLVGYKDVIVDFPWLLRAIPDNTNVLRMSPAAFGILLTLITRSFFKDSIGLLESLSASSESISSAMLMDRVYSEISLTQLPDPLFDAWAGYWDAE